LGLTGKTAEAATNVDTFEFDVLKKAVWIGLDMNGLWAPMNIASRPKLRMAGNQK
jgi:hypothetical protein